MDDQKYYTPEMREFHVGFEYEFQVKGQWYETTQEYCDPGLIDNGDGEYPVEYAVSINKIRVKYLDRVDIESLGFKPVIPSNLVGKANYEVNYWVTNNVGDSFQLIKGYPYNKNLYNISYGNPEKNVVLFNGIIKNKSKLKDLLEIVLGIIKL